MKYLYLLLNIGSLAIPFLFSFHPKLKFYKLWKPLFIGTILTMVIFIPWDVIFTNQGIWKFNDDYFLGITLLQLPMEEWLFFICIPYACVFTHYALLHYFPQMSLAIPTTKILSYTLIFILALLSIINYDKWYTLVNFILAVILISIVSTKNIKLLSEFYITFLIILIPFFIVNGILTGSFIDSEVVWYNNSENLNIRLFTIPVEDMVYAFSMILMNLFIMKQVIAEKT
ncbi:lycopene cyclase domain-containing protein [Flavivirga aquimarina]|uniref:Lycopene cyclase domain-containing protein n=1 Tax=Flavivirga aquimarina TaxID=2027862 RepID=A0ABT8WF23_9FLAO|nr:lycopene cyclase domain-containing protein [Flavivirga aquimarina]MDO5971716.1 lycopene cyclase domain-containing protein [Flavivirga aquimarina]